MCHQTVSLVARHLESVGIATVVVGSARDIVEELGVPRFLFVDFPLGNPCGRPGDAAMQRDIVRRALSVVSSSTAPRTTVQAPYRWDRDGWRAAYMEVTDDNLDELCRMGRERREHDG